MHCDVWSPSEWSEAQSALATNPGSRSVQTARPSRTTREVEELRRYEASKSSGTTTAALDEDIKTAALAVVPSELEQHLAMNRA